LITGELKGRVDRLWTTFWNNGISNPLSVIEQLSYLIFMKRLDGEELAHEAEARRFGGSPHRWYGAGQQGLRWGALGTISNPDEQLKRTREAFEHLRNLPGLETSPYAEHMKDAEFLVRSGSLIAAAIKQINEIFALVEREETSGPPGQLTFTDAVEGTAAMQKDLKGDLYEYMLSKLSQAGTNGQFRTPRHIIEMMVELVRPTLEDLICDPACGTAGFLVVAARYLKQVFAVELAEEPDAQEKLAHQIFHGYDFDGTMLRIASMNLLLHGVTHPDVKRADSLSSARADVRGKFSLVLANPPFKGSVDMDLVAEDLLKAVGMDAKKSTARKKKVEDDQAGTEKKGPSAKTELLFVAQILGALKMGGRAAVIVPDGVLFGSSKAHVAVRKLLVEEHLLDGVVSMPAGVFRPYAGVSTAILLFTKTGEGGTDDVWFYDMTADGFSLDDKRQPVAENDIKDVIGRWRTRDTAVDTDRGAKAFFVPKGEIVGQGYDLSINRYKKVEAVVVQHRAPGVIIGELLKLEGEIQKGLEKLKAVVG
jgi:type I restriction enzyme M protein